MANVYQSQYAKIAIKALNSDSASYALTASYAMNGGGGGGTPGGSNTTVQFNDAGAFSGSGTFTFDKTTNTVNITGSAILSGSVFMPGLTSSTAPQVLVYDDVLGQVYYTASAAFGGVGSSPGGPSTAIQFNDNGNFNGSSSFTFNGVDTAQLTGSMFVSGAISASFGPSTVGFFGTASWAQSASRAVTSSYPIDLTGSTLFSRGPVAGIPSIPTANNSIFFGDGAGFVSPNASQSNFLGYRAGYIATNANNSNFIGYSAGERAASANNSNFLGFNAGNNASLASQSNFLGYGAGNNSTYASDSNFIGYSSGLTSTRANNSNFLGFSAGQSATNASQSNFLGRTAGTSATNAAFSNFMGFEAGNSSTDANNSNFIGNGAGALATNASHSNFLGYRAGRSAINAPFSTLIGYQVGYNNVFLPGTSIGSNNIIIGTNITLPYSASNSINLGGIIFATGSYSTTTGAPFSGSAAGRVGINIYPPSYNLHVSGTVAFPNLTDSNTATNVVLIDSSGQLFYTASSAIGGGSGTPTSPGGLNTQIQFNSGSTFSGSGNFTFDYVTNAIQLTGSSLITGSLIVTGSTSVLGTSSINGIVLIGTSSAQALYTTARITTVAGINTIYSLPTASYDGTFFDYTLISGTNARAGQIMSIWSGSEIKYTETTTTDIGSTSNFIFSVALTAGSASLQVTGSTGAVIKTIIKGI